MHGVEDGGAAVPVEQAPAREGIDEDVVVDLVAQQEVPGHAHPHQRDAEAPPDRHGEHGRG